MISIILFRRQRCLGVPPLLLWHDLLCFRLLFIKILVNNSSFKDVCCWRFWGWKYIVIYHKTIDIQEGCSNWQERCVVRYLSGSFNNSASMSLISVYAPLVPLGSNNHFKYLMKDEESEKTFTLMFIIEPKGSPSLLTSKEITSSKNRQKSLVNKGCWRQTAAQYHSLTPLNACNKTTTQQKKELREVQAWIRLINIKILLTLSSLF